MSDVFSERKSMNPCNMSCPYKQPCQVPPGYIVPPSQPPPAQYPPFPQHQQPYPCPPAQGVPFNPAPQPTSRTLHVQNADLPQPHILITDPMTSAPLYTITSPKRSHFSSDSHMTIQSCFNKNTLATVRFDSMSGNIDLVIHGQAVKFKESTWSSSHEFVGEAEVENS